MRPALLRMAIRYLEDSDEAEDAVQDALLKLWFLRDRLDNTAAWMHWLLL